MINDVLDTTTEGIRLSIEKSSDAEGSFKDSRFREWEYETMRQELTELKKALSELRITLNNSGGISEVSDRRAKGMVTEFILEQRRSGRKTLKGIEVAESLRLPADQVERILDGLVKNQKLSRL